MSEWKLAVFEDGGGQWGPLTDRRPVFDLRSGAGSNLDRIERALQPAALLVAPDRLAAVTAERHAPTPVNTPVSEGAWLLVNGRWPALAAVEQVRDLSLNHALVQPDGTIVAAHVAADAAQQIIAARFGDVPASITLHRLNERVLVERPWQVLANLESALTADLVSDRALRDLPQVQTDLARGLHVVGEHPVRIAPSATILPMVSINAEHGPVVIDEQARIESFAALEGPCYVGPRTHLAAHTGLRIGTTIGPDCKVGGELKHAIIHGRSNKAHLGYFGDAIMGEWCNLGADTNVSNLKNTYSAVRMQLEPDEDPQDTGTTSQGPILGDFVRTAIGSRLLTGSVIGTGCMLAVSHFAPKHARRFTFCTDRGEATHELTALLGTAQRMMERRDMELTDTEAELLRQLHTAATAQIA